MTMTILRQPVTVAAGLGTRRELKTLFDLLDFLNEWPIARRGPVYLTAYRACTAALAGQVTSEQARQAFLSFVRLSSPVGGSPAAARPFAGTMAAGPTRPADPMTPIG